MGWTAEQTSWMNPGNVSSAERTPPPIVGSASNDRRLAGPPRHTMAAASPFGPEPTTIAPVGCHRWWPIVCTGRICLRMAIGTRAGCSSGGSRYLPDRVSRRGEPVRAAARRARAPAGPRGSSRGPFSASPSLFFFAPTDRAFRIARLARRRAVACSRSPASPQRRSALAQRPRLGGAVDAVSLVRQRRTDILRLRLGDRCCSRPDSSRSSSAAQRRRQTSWLHLDLPVDAVPADVRRRPDQDARRPVLARSDVPRLLLRDAADARTRSAGTSTAAARRATRPASWSITSSSWSCRSALRAAADRRRSPALITIAFQLSLIVSGNLSWLNWLTIVLVHSTLDDRLLSWLPVSPPALHDPALHTAARLGAGRASSRS